MANTPDEQIMEAINSKLDNGSTEILSTIGQELAELSPCGLLSMLPNTTFSPAFTIKTLMLKCGQCNSLFNTSQDLRKHEATHEAR